MREKTILIEVRQEASEFGVRLLEPDLYSSRLDSSEESYFLMVALTRRPNLNSNQAMADRILREIRRCTQIELVHDVRFMKHDGPSRDPEDRCDAVDGSTLCNQLQYFTFACSQNIGLAS